MNIIQRLVDKMRKAISKEVDRQLVIRESEKLGRAEGEKIRDSKLATEAFDRGKKKGEMPLHQRVWGKQ